MFTALRASVWDTQFWGVQCFKGAWEIFSTLRMKDPLVRILKCVFFWLHACMNFLCPSGLTDYPVSNYFSGVAFTFLVWLDCDDDNNCDVSGWRPHADWTVQIYVGPGTLRCHWGKHMALTSRTRFSEPCSRTSDTNPCPCCVSSTSTVSSSMPTMSLVTRKSRFSQLICLGKILWPCRYLVGHCRHSWKVSWMKGRVDSARVVFCVCTICRTCKAHGTTYTAFNLVTLVNATEVLDLDVSRLNECASCWYCVPCYITRMLFWLAWCSVVLMMFVIIRCALAIALCWTYRGTAWRQRCNNSETPP